jgi:ankyrin repeat protein
MATKDTSPSETLDETSVNKNEPPEPNSLVSDDNGDKTRPLFSAAFTGDEEKVKRLLDEGVNPSLQHHDGLTPLHAAAQEQHEEVVRLLLSRGADITATGAAHIIESNGKDEVIQGWTVLHSAAFGGHEGIITLLLESGVDLRSPTNQGYTPLMVAVSRRNASAVKLLLERSADSSIQDLHGVTPLYSAIILGDEEIVKILLPLEDINLSTKIINGNTLLMGAVEAGKAEIVKLLVERGANVSEPARGYTPLLKALQTENNEIATFLLSRPDIEVSPRSPEGWTALFAAVHEGYEQIVKLLLDRGIDPSERIDDGLTPLHLAAATGLEEIVKLLLSIPNIDVSPRFATGTTPLLAAAATGYDRVVILLLSRGANLLEKDENGVTALHSAILGEHKDVINVLLDSGADIEARDTDEKTPLHYAVNANHVKVVELLLKRGADARAVDKNGHTPFLDSVVRGRKDIVDLLLDEDPEALDKDVNGFTPLQIACQVAQESVASLLVGRGANVLAEASNGWSVIHSAAAGGHIGIIEMLLDRGANASKVKDNGWSVLHTTAEMGRDDAFNLFLERGVPLSATTDNRTPLLIAAEYGRKGPVKVLLDKGQNVNEVSEEGYTPLHMAVKNGHEAIVRILLDYGAAISTPTKDRWNSLHLARQGEQQVIVDILNTHRTRVLEKLFNQMKHEQVAVDINHYRMIQINSSGWTADVEENTVSSSTTQNLLQEVEHITHDALDNKFHGFETWMKHDAERSFQEIHGNVQNMLRQVEDIQLFRVLSSDLPDIVNHLRFLHFKGFPEFDSKKISTEKPLEIELELTPPTANPFTVDYITVSYVWQRPSPIEISSNMGLPRYRIKDLERPDSEPREILCPPDVLHRACRFARSVGVSLIWIDQECIKQDDPGDVDKHLQSMNKIYSQSRYTVVPLCQMVSDPEKAKVFSFLCNRDISDETIRSIESVGFLELCAKVLEDIAGDEWFTRAWTYQERICASQVRLLINRDPSLANYHGLGKEPTEIELNLSCLREFTFRFESDKGVHISSLERAKVISIIQHWYNLVTKNMAYATLIAKGLGEGRGDAFVHQISNTFYALEACRITKESDRLAILSDLCELPNRLNSTLFNDSKYSFSTCVLVLLLNNGFIPKFPAEEDGSDVFPVPLYMNILEVFWHILVKMDPDFKTKHFGYILNSPSPNSSGSRMVWQSNEDPKSELSWPPSDNNAIKEYSQRSPVAFLVPQGQWLETKPIEDDESLIV